MTQTNEKDIDIYQKNLTINISMTKTLEEQVIQKAVDLFIAWELPKDFHPDAGIEFTKEYNVSYNEKEGKPPCIHEPTGTNLFTAQQAEVMIRHILKGLPEAIQTAEKRVAEDIVNMSDKLEATCNDDYDKGTLQWKHFKGFRNTIRDKYITNITKDV